MAFSVTAASFRGSAMVAEGVKAIAGRLADSAEGVEAVAGWDEDDAVAEEAAAEGLGSDAGVLNNGVQKLKTEMGGEVDSMVFGAYPWSRRFRHG